MEPQVCERHDVRDRVDHKTGLCSVHLGSLYHNCPKLEKFAGVPIASQDGLNFPKWNNKLKTRFYEDYVKKGGRKDLETWARTMWFCRRPKVPELFGAERFKDLRS